MSKTELDLHVQALRQLRTSPPTLAKNLKDDEELADVVESLGVKAPRKKSTAKDSPPVDISSLLAQAEAFQAQKSNAPSPSN